jgi:hypothetical protein
MKPRSGFEIRKALIKLLVVTVVLAGLVSSCFVDSVGDLKGLIIFFIVVLVFPITILIGIDASRVINRELPSHKALRVMGRVLAFPQAVMGAVLIGFAIGYPVFGVRELMQELAKGNWPLLPIGGLIVSVLGFAAGLRYIREGLGLGNRNS